MAPTTTTRTGEIEAIFFDLDNTLIETRKGDKLACNKLTEILREKYSIPNEISTKICSNYLRAFRKCPENPSMDLDVWRKLLWAQALGNDYKNLADEIYLTWIQLRYRYLALSTETLKLLENLRKNNYLLGLITNGPSCAQWEKIQRLDLRSLFDIILVSGDLPWEKPNQRIFYEACDYLKVKPSKCLMVGDKMETDILGGIQANLGGTVWIPLTQDIINEEEEKNNFRFRPDYVIDNVNELIDLLLPVSENNDRKRNFVRMDIFDGNSNGSDCCS
ncbi:N-acylneuraminate-9-phosphatase [Onthophagus taurus]|uniref:N-acylneuraminate-9-phosphatase n=1 Tax=Onthophagus taurus TaxID=166361 RepID=UPI0039BEAA16